MRHTIRPYNSPAWIQPVWILESSANTPLHSPLFCAFQTVLVPSHAVRSVLLTGADSSHVRAGTSLPGASSVPDVDGSAPPVLVTSAQPR